MAVRIVTDSSSCLPAEIATVFDITVIDLHIMNRGDDRTTAGLNPLELVACYARQLERGGDDGVVALHISKELSATWSNAVTAAGIFENTVRVLDTNSVGMSLGSAAIAAATCAQAGGNLEACADAATKILERAETWLYVHRIDELRKSGRVSAATALMSTALATKPIMHLKDGKLEVVGKTRTQAKAFAKIVDLVKTNLAGGTGEITLQQHEAREAARRLRDMLTETLTTEEPPNITIIDMEPVLAIHSGPGSIAITVVRDTD
ncbi:DegV family protein [Corynebacterium freiburgense]|uniref:DegV family protein n=1 Tax=Corynebacterium freiburgense TaxID=556548 RepID=UPI000404E97D|nr:DegV family protein [Corynebacterium freiburgense]WJZ03380.1 DegV domain-containing protein [Corynebacterium freiburgense]